MMPMADRDNARSEFNPRHRIVGAAVLVVLGVVFVPMILSEREPPAEYKGVREAPPRTATTETKVIVTPVPISETESKESSAATKITPPPDASKPAPETKPAATADKTEAGWMVLVGTFSNTQNARRLRDKLKSLGYSVRADSATVGGKKALRLRVGPFAGRAKADKAQAQIRKETGVTGVVQSQT